jgi:CO/xanthine dehydrogenase FAD-binding subunit
MRINAYHRPQTLEAALALLARPAVTSLPMGGGTYLSRKGWFPNREGSSGRLDPEYEAVDLQALGLKAIHFEEDTIQVGATVTLQSLLDQMAHSGFKAQSTALGQALTLEASSNLRQMATIAGQLVCTDGRSALATALLALDARLNWEPGAKAVGLGNWLPLRSKAWPGVLITWVGWSRQAALALEVVGRSPLDRPVVCVAVAAWPSHSTPGGSGRTRVALGGFGDSPVLALDGPEPGGAEVAAQSAYSGAEDAWASAAYRQEVAGILTRRALTEVTALQLANYGAATKEG